MAGFQHLYFRRKEVFVKGEALGLLQVQRNPHIENIQPIGVMEVDIQDGFIFLADFFVFKRGGLNIGILVGFPAHADLERVLGSEDVVIPIQISKADF